MTTSWCQNYKEVFVADAPDNVRCKLLQPSLIVMDKKAMSLLLELLNVTYCTLI